MLKRLSFKSRRSPDDNEVSDERRTMIEKEPYRPLKSRENGRPTLSNLTRRTFGKGYLRRAVQTPANEDVIEWIAANAVDFYNELSFLYGYVVDDAERFIRPGEGFPPNVEYRWPVGEGKTLRLSSPEYVEYAFTWMEDTIDNEEIFPVDMEQEFPDEFVDVYVRKMFKLMFRIFAILFHQHFEAIEIMGGAAHMNTCFKHFVFFMLEHNLAPDEQEILAARSVFERYRKQYEETAP